MNTGETEQPTVPENSWAGAQLPSPVQPGTAPGQIAWPQDNGLPTAPLGKIRGTGACIALAFVTFGIYPIAWYYMIHDEMKRHSGDGLGGGLALVLAIFVGFVMPFISSSEVGALYEKRGMTRPVSGATGLWYIPGFMLLVGPLVWFVKTNSALNNYWRGLGAR